MNPSLKFNPNLYHSCRKPSLLRLALGFLGFGEENYFYPGVPPLTTLDLLKSKHAKLPKTPLSLGAFIESQAPWKLLLPVGLLTLLYPEGRHKLILNVP